MKPIPLHSYISLLKSSVDTQQRDQLEEMNELWNLWLDGETMRLWPENFPILNQQGEIELMSKHFKKYANNYPDDFIPTHTWEQAKQEERNREEKQGAKVKGNIEFKVMSSWHRLCLLSIEKPKGLFYKMWRKIKLPKEKR